MRRHPISKFSGDDTQRLQRRFSSFAARAEMLIGAGAIAGVLSRYGIGEWTSHYIGGLYPTGTFAVNLLGCFIIGIVQYLGLERRTLSRSWQLVLAVGFCGGFTTFSTFSVETLRLIEDGYLVFALGYQMFSIAGSVLALICGAALAKRGSRVLGRNERAP
jgi:fluoride exporter